MSAIDSSDGIKFLITPRLRGLLLFLTWIVGSMMAALLAMLLTLLLSGNQLGLLRINVVVGDIFTFIIPALVTAIIITRQPAQLLSLTTLPSWRQVFLAVALLIVSSPFMSWIIRLNSEFHFPQSLSGVENTLRSIEENAEHLIQTLLDVTSVGAVIVNVLIIGVLAGFSEELFFRGALQRILSTARVNIHVSIWVTAFIFSAMHMQFFGFAPRLLLGAAFGYLLWWSGSVWLPMLIHALNNSMFVILENITGSGDPAYSGSTSWAAIVLSVALTILALGALYRSRTRQEAPLLNKS